MTMLTETVVVMVRSFQKILVEIPALGQILKNPC